MKFWWKNIENWWGWKMTFFELAIFLFFSQWKTTWRFIWGIIYFCTMVSSESRKRLYSIYYAYDCTVASHCSLEYQIWCLQFIYKLINLSTYLYFQADKKGTVDNGPKSWASSSGGNEDSPGWTQWIFPVGIALLAAIGYRTVFPGNWHSS